MRSPRRASVAAELLPRDAEEQLLQRAAELDMGRSTQLDTLRAAAVEAGIHPDAFEAALDEMRAGGAATGSPERRRRVWLSIASGVVMLLAVGIASLPGVAHPRVATVEQAIALRCLSPGDAAALVRPLMNDVVSQIVVSPTQAPHVLTVRTTAEKLRRVRDFLDRQDGAACHMPRATL